MDNAIKEVFIREKEALEAEIKTDEAKIAELQSAVKDKRDDLRIIDRLVAKHFAGDLEAAAPAEPVIADSGEPESTL